MMPAKIMMMLMVMMIWLFVMVAPLLDVQWAEWGNWRLGINDWIKSTAV